MAKMLRLGLLGTGVAARELYLPAFRRLHETVEVVACANRRREKADRYARLARIPLVVDSAEELFALPQVEAVLISLPIHLQPRYVLQALAAGKPVLSEKPVAPSVAAGRKLVAAAARFEVPWLVGENFAFMPAVSRLRRWISEGRLGELRLVQAEQIALMDSKNPYYHTDRRAEPKHVGGFVVDGGVHVAHVIRTLFGMPTIKSLTAAFDPDLPPLDTAVATLRFPSGVVGTWTSCFSAPADGPFLKLYGNKARAELGRSDLRLFPARGKPIEYRPREGSIVLELRHFADVVLRGVPPLVTPAEALLDLALVETIVRAR